MVQSSTDFWVKPCERRWKRTGRKFETRRNSTYRHTLEPPRAILTNLQLQTEQAREKPRGRKRDLYAWCAVSVPQLLPAANQLPIAHSSSGNMCPNASVKGSFSIQGRPGRRYPYARRTSAFTLFFLIVKITTSKIVCYLSSQGLIACLWHSFTFMKLVNWLPEGKKRKENVTRPASGHSLCGSQADIIGKHISYLPRQVAQIVRYLWKKKSPPKVKR